MAQTVAEKYGKFTRYNVYGDYSGTGRDTRSLTTDYEIIKQILPNIDLRIQVNPSVIERTNTVNARLCNANGNRSLFVNAKNCPHLVKDLEQVVHVEGKRDIDKSNPDKTHSSDAAGYRETYLYSIKGRPQGKQW
jgi:hypothetical protein